MRPIPILIPLLAWMPLLAQPPPPAPLWTPADSVTAALADVQRLPPDQQRHARYLNLGNVPEADRPDLIHVLAGHVNGLNREVDKGVLVIVKGVRGALLRLDVRHYGWDLKVWERLFDPLHHAKIQTETITNWPGGVWTDGRYYAANTFRVKKVKTVAGLAPWLGKDVAALAALTYSTAPIVSGQWFLWQTAVQQGRGKEGYYDFLGVKNQKDFEALVRFDARQSRQLEHRRVMIFSGVTQEPRRVELTATVLGTLHRTFDNILAQDKANPLRVMDDKDFRFKATEQFAPLACGMPAWYLGNDKGVRADKAPDNIVGGERRTLKTLELQVNLDCIFCHTSGKRRGIVELTGAAKLTISSPVYEKYLELKRQYLRDVEPRIDADRRGYDAAILAITGLTAEKYGTEYVKWYARYDEARVDLAWVARDFGVDPARLRAALTNYGPTLDPFLDIVRGGGQIPIRQYEEVIPLAWEALVKGGVR